MINYKNFSSKLVKRLLIPYYLAEILWYPIWLVAGHWLGHDAYIRNTALTPLDAFTGIFIGNGNMLAPVPLWFLPALFFAEIIFIKLHNRLAEVGADVCLRGRTDSQKYKVHEQLNLRRCLLLVIIFAAVFCLNGNVDMCFRIYGGNLFLFCAGGIAGTLLVMKLSMAAVQIGGKFCSLVEYCGRQSLFVMIMHLPTAFVIYDAASSILNMTVKDVRPLPEVIILAILLGTLVPLWIAKNFGKKPVLKYLCT